MKLSDKTALVTGGTSGIGKAIARRFVQEGARVAVVGSRDLRKAESTAKEISRESDRVRPFVADVARPDQVERLVVDVTREFGEVDILINSAGVWFPTPVGDTSPSDFERMVDINLKGTFLMMSAVVPAMKRRRSGRIVNLSSVVALIPAAGYCLYAGVKAAIIAVTKSAAVELAPHGIRVNAIAPGNTETPMNEAIRRSPEAEDRRAWIKRITPSNRTFTPPEEIAAGALFLVSDEVQAMYGSVLVIDEGRTAGLPSR